jgi:hypothetical protein
MASTSKIYPQDSSGPFEYAPLEYYVNMLNSEEEHPSWREWRFSDVAFEGRRLDRPGPEGTYRVPVRVSASDDRIEYWYTDPDAPVGVVSNVPEGSSARRTGRALPPGFARVSDQQLKAFTDAGLNSEAAVVRFAERWGVLGICDHGLPRTHSAGLSTLCAPLGHDSMEDGGWEPTAAWRFFRRQAFLILRTSDRLRRGERVDRSTWLELFDEDGPRLAYDRAIDFTDPSGTPRVSQPLDLQTGLTVMRAPVLSWVLEEDDWDRPVWECDRPVQRWCAGLIMQSWLEVGRPEMLASWSGRGADVWVSARSLFGVLAMKVAFAASGSPGFAICHECHALFLPKRRAKAGQRTYCAECRANKVPRRDAARDFRERQGAKPRSGR